MSECRFISLYFSVVVDSVVPVSSGPIIESKGYCLSKKLRVVHIRDYTYMLLPPLLLY